jgi:hypothetical protein
MSIGVEYLPRGFAGENYRRKEEYYLGQMEKESNRVGQKRAAQLL